MRRLRKICEAEVGHKRDGNLCYKLQEDAVPSNLEVAEGRLQELLRDWKWSKLSESKFMKQSGIIDLESHSLSVIKRHMQEAWESALLAEDSRGAMPDGRQQPCLDAHQDAAAGWCNHKILCCRRLYPSLAQNSPGQPRTAQAAHTPQNSPE